MNQFSFETKKPLIISLINSINFNGFIKILRLLITLNILALNILFGQDVFEIFNPINLDNVFNSLKQGETKKVDITLDQNVKYNFIEKKKYSHDIELNFNLSPKDSCNLVIRNINFENFKMISFQLNKLAAIIIENCQFKNVDQIKFHFSDLSYFDRMDTTLIQIKNCQFEDTDLSNNGEYITSMLSFRGKIDLERSCILKGVKIVNCNFTMRDEDLSFIKYGYYPTRNFIFFERQNENVSYQDILIINNTFEAHSKYFRIFGIVFTNAKYNSNFRNEPVFIYFNKNHNINISGNNLKTDSADPGHGIFIQGPYRDLKVENNQIINFGAYIRGNALNSDGALHIYGSRFGPNSSYSNNSEMVFIKNNLITTRSHGIVLSGVKIGDIRLNKVVMLPESPFYSDSVNIDRLDRIGIFNTTGDVTDVSKQSENILIESNEIKCNGINTCVGIVIHPTKNFIIRGNYIFKPKNFGILFYSNRNFVNQFLGMSLIENNLIDYDNLKFTSLNSFFYKFTNSIYAGINFTRHCDSTYSGEYLSIRNNEIITVESRILPVVLIPDQIENNNVYLQKNNIVKIEN